ncbi:MAG: hypothetical protein C4617_03280 [Candidatus Liberibacter europaeus]|uniref:Uncharacterized protein n=1 Tax=Candidatus Liberibacter europaeus TaxID=744859 RepID=A0A2T4VXD8_9HYPH|nr:MAG: hypothetical protein C4617_03280 [Candidatus Liberibacter europaeus]
MSNSKSYIDIITTDGNHLELGMDWEDKTKKYKVEWKDKKGVSKSVAIQPSKSEADTLTQLFFNIGIILLRTHGALKKIDEPDLDDISEKGKKNIRKLAEMFIKEEKQGK